MSRPPHDSAGPLGSVAQEIRLAPDQLADLFAGGLTVLAPGGVAIRLVPDYSSAPVTGRCLVDAATVAQEIGMSAPWVREHAEILGGQRMGDGPRPRLRFDLERARAAWASRSVSERPLATDPTPRAASRRRRSTTSGSDVELLPVRGQLGGRHAA
ncbi:hypothetical protein [Baekduia alba]|uniref:hypothetical protein n=1 Tax=Baekduia alba TaxID=2997333 RepID=UPI0023425949|nr:hypothetical protein [Baekduia alba]